jgi:hypothetical protein
VAEFNSPGIQTYTIGTSGTYDISADGAQGGASTAASGGFGAAVAGDVYLETGTKLEVVTGGEGGSAPGAGGGGGGSFVIETYNGTIAVDTILAVAGGGGGAAYFDGGGGGGVSPTGGNGRGISGGAGGTNGAAGHGGFLGIGVGGGGGGGFTGGGPAENGAVAGNSFSGGSGSSSGLGGEGGVGGGGGGNFLAGGGGGGFGGGGGGGLGFGGGGGGSYLDASLVTHGVESAAANDGNGSVTINAVCYVSGTRILTERGEVAVENLTVGDRVVTASRAHRPVRWLGHRRVDCARHPEPSAVWPICIQAGAFAQGLPARDLWVSPGHSILVDGVLIQAEKLVNGASITQVPLTSVEYWHVELDSHDILLAEGLPAESYLDTGNRTGFFNNGGSYVEAHPDFKPKHWAETCVPLVLDGPEIHQAKAQLLARAQLLGYVLTAEDSDAHILADGRRIEALRLGEGRLLFMLPEASTTIELRCRSFVPAHTDAKSHDQRTLGLCVRRLRIDAIDVTLDDEAAFSAGWHELERSTDGRPHRWTHARASLPAGTQLVVIDMAFPNRHCWAKPATEALAFCG